MITNLIEFRNFLPDPDNIVEIAKQSKFYSLNEHPKTLDKTDRKLYWEGMRSDSIYMFNKSLSDYLFDRMFQEITKRCVGDYQYGMKYEYIGNSSFHYFTEKDVYNDSWKHNDNGSLFAGVLYLNKEPKENTGTIVSIDGKDIEIKNEYNKLVLYPAYLIHHAQSGFGKTVDDARLSIVFFVSNIRFALSCG